MPNVAVIGLLIVLCAAPSCAPPSPAPSPAISAQASAPAPAAVSAAPIAMDRPAPEGSGDYTALRTEVGKLCSPECGKCHRTSSPERKEGALAIFDLDREDWPSTLKPKHHDGFRKRLLGKADDPTKKQVEAFLAALLVRSAEGATGAQAKGAVAP